MKYVTLSYLYKTLVPGVKTLDVCLVSSYEFGMRNESE